VEFDPLGNTKESRTVLLLRVFFNVIIRNPGPVKIINETWDVTIREY